MAYGKNNFTFQRTVLFRVITRQGAEISYRRFGTIYPSHPQGSRIQKGCPESSVRNYHYSPCNSPEERSSQLLDDGSLKSRKFTFRLQWFFCDHYYVSTSVIRPRFLHFYLASCRQMSPKLSRMSIVKFM